MRICPFAMSVGIPQTTSNFNRVTRCVEDVCAIWDTENSSCVIYSSLKGKPKEVEKDIETEYLEKKAGRPKKGE